MTTLTSSDLQSVQDLPTYLQTFQDIKAIAIQAFPKFKRTHQCRVMSIRVGSHEDLQGMWGLTYKPSSCIELSPDWEQDDLLYDTILHEVAHVVAWALCPSGHLRDHDVPWQHVYHTLWSCSEKGRW